MWHINITGSRLIDMKDFLKDRTFRVVQSKTAAEKNSQNQCSSSGNDLVNNMNQNYIIHYCENSPSYPLEKQRESSYVIVHHGIKGQRWYHRRYQNPDGSLTALGKQRYGKGNGSNVDGCLNPATVYLAFTAANAACFAISRIRKSLKVRSAMRQASEISNDKAYASERLTEKVDSETGLYLINEKMTEEENMKRINPSYDSKNLAFGVNCTACTVSMELRERGFDVHAGIDGSKMLSAGGTTIPERMSWYTDNPYKNTKRYIRSENNIAKFRQDILRDGDARGEFSVQYKVGGGHSLYYKVKNGQLYIYDTQSNKKMTDSELSTLLSSTSTFSYTRLDQAKPDVDYLKSHNYIC